MKKILDESVRHINVEKIITFARLSKENLPKTPNYAFLNLFEMNSLEELKERNHIIGMNALVKENIKKENSDYSPYILNIILYNEDSLKLEVEEKCNNIGLTFRQRSL